MATTFDAWTRPKAGTDVRSKSRQRTTGFVLAFIGLMLAVVTLIANIAAANTSSEETAAETLAWSFGLTTTGFTTLKLGISIILVGILVRLWLRVESVKAALPDLRASGDGSVQTGNITTAFGPGTAGSSAPKPLPVHKMARTLWFPMVAMGYMAVIVSLVISFVWTANVGTGTGNTAQAWTQGLGFLGEGMLLSGIAFLLGSILASLREGGGQVQESLGVTVKTLKMPATAKAFMALMMLGMMLAVLQFILYLVATSASGASFAAWLAWLGPLRETALGLILAGIVLALVTIGNVLAFQFDRIKEIVVTGN